MDNNTIWLNSFKYDDTFINVSFNNLKYKDLLSLNNSSYSSNFIDNSLVLSSYESLINSNDITTCSYQLNYLTFIDKDNMTISFIENKYKQFKDNNTIGNEVDSTNWKYTILTVKTGDSFYIKSEGNNTILYAFTDQYDKIYKKVDSKYLNNPSNNIYNNGTIITALYDGHLIVNFNIGKNIEYELIPIKWEGKTKKNNIIPLTYNVKYSYGVLGLSDNIIDVSIDNYTVKDSINYIPYFTASVNINDSYSYIIDTYNYKNGPNVYTYEIKYSYSFQSAYDYSYENPEKIHDEYSTYGIDSYSYYILTYDYQDKISNLAYNIEYISTYSYFKTNIINNFIYVDENNLDKASYNIGLYKSDKDTLKIENDSLTINDKYLNLIYYNNIQEYTYIYNTLNKRYKELLEESLLFSTYVFNYRPYEELCILFSKNEDIMYFDKKQKLKKLNYIDYIQIDNDIDEFNLCIPFEYSYKSKIEEINPIDLSKILINILNKKINDGDQIIINNQVLDVKDYYDYNYLFDNDFQNNISSDDIISYFYNMKYYDLNKFYKLTEFVKFDINSSYLVDKKIEKYENGKYYGKARYVFNFKIDKEGYYKNLEENYDNSEISDFLINNFDVILTIKDSILGDCNVINANYKLSFSFYIIENNKLYNNETQIYDILYHDYNAGFNFENHGKMVGICFAPQNLTNNKKPIFCKYDQYNDLININTNKVDNFINISNLNLFSDNSNNYNIDINEATIEEIYYKDKISNISFNHLLKSINIENNSNDIVSPNIEVSNYQLHFNNNNDTTINKIFDNKSVQNNILEKNFKEIYNLTSSGLRKGDYYIPTVYEYYLMSLYNILSLYKIYNTQNFIHNLVSSLFYNKSINDPENKDGYLITLTVNNESKKINKIHLSLTNSNIENKYVLPIFKLPDYSIIMDESYNIIFDTDLNCECVVINTYNTGYFKLKVKQYYNYINNIDNNIWQIKEVSGKIKERCIINYINNEIDVYYNYNTNNKNNILIFDIGFIDSDNSLNTYKINENDCRILCKVIIKIKS